MLFVHLLCIIFPFIGYVVIFPSLINVICLFNVIYPDFSKCYLSICCELSLLGVGYVICPLFVIGVFLVCVIYPFNAFVYHMSLMYYLSISSMQLVCSVVGYVIGFTIRLLYYHSVGP